MSQLQDEYQVRLDAFCGPLDLLLYLIRRAEVDVSDIRISQITDQYLQFLRQVNDIDFEAAGEFLVMAATLMEIKSRALMPPEPLSDDESSPGAAQEIEMRAGEPLDPRFELVQQLLEYQRYRMATESLEHGRREFSRQFPLLPSYGTQEQEPSGQHDLELEDAHVFDLYEIYSRIIASIDFDRMGDHRVEIDDTPAALYQDDLLDRLQRAPAGRMTLLEVFEGQDRGDRLGLFLALLELVRLRRLNVLQEDLSGDIKIELSHEPPLAGPDEPQVR